jgi:hypothetical protein
MKLENVKQSKSNYQFAIVSIENYNDIIDSFKLNRNNNIILEATERLLINKFNDDLILYMGKGEFHMIILDSQANEETIEKQIKDTMKTTMLGEKEIIFLYSTITIADTDRLDTLLWRCESVTAHSL